MQRHKATRSSAGTPNGVVDGVLMYLCVLLYVRVILVYCLFRGVQGRGSRSAASSLDTCVRMRMCVCVCICACSEKKKTPGTYDASYGGTGERRQSMQGRDGKRRKEWAGNREGGGGKREGATTWEHRCVSQQPRTHKGDTRPVL